MHPASDSHSAKITHPFIECAPPVPKRMSHYVLILQEKSALRHSKTIKAKTLLIGGTLKVLKKSSVLADVGR